MLMESGVIPHLGFKSLTLRIKRLAFRQAAFVIPLVLFPSEYTVSHHGQRDIRVNPGYIIPVN